MNKCLFSGRVSKKAQMIVKQNPDGKEIKVIRYTFAVDDGYADDAGNKTSSFLHMVAFGGNAEFVDKHVDVGDKLLVECRAKENRYTDKENVQRSSIEFHVINQEFGESKADKERRKAAAAAQQSNNIPAYAPMGNEGYVQNYAPAPNGQMSMPQMQSAQPIPQMPMNTMPQQQPAYATAPQQAVPVQQTMPQQAIPVQQTAPVAPQQTAPIAPMAPIPGSDFSTLPGNFYSDEELPFN